MNVNNSPLPPTSAGSAPSTFNSAKFKNAKMIPAYQSRTVEPVEGIAGTFSHRSAEHATPVRWSQSETKLSPQPPAAHNPGEPVKLLELLNDPESDPVHVKTALEELVKQFQKLHVNAMVMHEVALLEGDIQAFIEIMDGKHADNARISRTVLTQNIQNLADKLALWAEVHKDNLSALTYLIDRGVPIQQESDWMDQRPETTVHLPFDTMEKLVDNCAPGMPDMVFIRAVFSDPDPRFDQLSEQLLKSLPAAYNLLLQEAIAQAIPKASLARLSIFFRFLHDQRARSGDFADQLKENLTDDNYHHHRYVNLFSKNRYPSHIVTMFTLEAIAQKSPEEARQLLASFSQNDQEHMVCIALASGLHQSAELLTEQLEKGGVAITNQLFEQASVFMQNSSFLMACEAGLTNERLFVASVNRVAPFLWTLPNKEGNHLLQQKAYRRDWNVVPFIHLVRAQISASDETFESQKWLGPKRSELDLLDMSLWAAKVFAVKGNPELLKKTQLLQQNPTYSGSWNALLRQAERCHGLSRPEDFQRFSDWLLLEGLEWIKSDHLMIERQLSARQKRFRPDIWPNPDMDSGWESLSDCKLRGYVADITQLHCRFADVLLRMAPPAYRRYVLNNWLNHPDCAQQREVLFPKPIHPLNNLGINSSNMWQMLLSVDKDYQPPINAYDAQWKTVGRSNQWMSPPTLASLKGKSVEVFGRTLVIRQKDGSWHYLKLVSDTETPDDLAEEGEKINLMATIAEQQGLRSSFPTVLGQYRWDGLQTELDTVLTPAKKAKLEQKCRTLDGTGYALHLSSKKTAPYHLYPYDLKPTSQSKQIVDGLVKYANDCGVLFNLGLYAPNVMAADHDKVTRRKHHVLSSYVDAFAEGRMLQWKKASEHPNVGPVGMRDCGDTKSMAEFSDDYFFSSRTPQFLDVEKTEDRAKVALSELAQNAHGLVLQYARCFQKQFDINNKKSTTHHEKNLKKVLTTLFTKAFPNLTDQDIEQALEENGLLSQAVKELVYWCSYKAPFVEDIQQNVVPRSVYPNCSERAGILPLADAQYRELTPGVGFVTRDNEPNLGITYGVNPLVTLNAVIVKLLAKGALSAVG